MNFAAVKLLFLILPFLFSSPEQPSFKGNGKSLEQFLSDKMIYPIYAKHHCIQRTIHVSFQLNHEGKVMNTHVKDGLGIDLDEEALRLIVLTSYKWKIPSGYDERTILTVPIHFSLKNFGCELKPKSEIEQAITDYQTLQALENVVTNYYQNKSDEAVDQNDEQKINKLKAELGFDQELVAQKLEEAKLKLRQGDKDAACKALHFIKNIGFNDADALIAENCK